VDQAGEFIDLFRTRGKRFTYAKGEFIIRPGDVPSGVFYIESGLVKAYDITKYGEENLLIIRKTGEIFPLIWALTAQGKYVIYEALAPTVVWRIDRTVFVQAVRDHPGIIFPFLDTILEMYRMHSERILNLEYRSVRERLVSFLLLMAQRFGEPFDGGMLIKAPLKHQDIASSINASRETTSREMILLERKGLLKNKQTYITLIDIEKLKNIL
jgi:CRP/FNR family transcriptional regulator